MSLASASPVTVSTPAANDTATVPAGTHRASRGSRPSRVRRGANFLLVLLVLFANRPLKKRFSIAVSAGKKRNERTPPPSREALFSGPSGGRAPSSPPTDALGASGSCPGSVACQSLNAAGEEK